MEGQSYFSRLLNIIIIAILFIAINNYLEVRKTNNYNLFVYLRKISLSLEKLIKINEPFDKDWEYNSILESYQDSEVIITSILKQIKCYDSGKVRTGFLANFIPKSFLNDEEYMFDICNDAILKYYANYKHYLKEDLDLLKETLLKRTTMAPWQRNYAIEFEIKGKLDYIIKKEIADYIREKNDYKVGSNLSYKIKQYMNEEKSKIILNKLLQDKLDIQSYKFRKFILKTCI